MPIVQLTKIFSILRYILLWGRLLKTNLIIPLSVKVHTMASKALNYLHVPLTATIPVIACPSRTLWVNHVSFFPFFHTLLPTAEPLLTPFPLPETNVLLPLPTAHSSSSLHLSLNVLASEHPSLLVPLPQVGHASFKALVSTSDMGYVSGCLCPATLACKLHDLVPSASPWCLMESRAWSMPGHRLISTSATKRPKTAAVLQSTHYWHNRYSVPSFGKLQSTERDSGAKSMHWAMWSMENEHLKAVDHGHKIGSDF